MALTALQGGIGTEIDGILARIISCLRLECGIFGVVFTVWNSYAGYSGETVDVWTSFVAY